MRNYIIAFCVLVAGLVQAGTASFDAIKAASVTIGTNPAITTIIVNGTNYTGATVTIPPGPKGDTGPVGPTSTNTEYIGYSFTSVVQNVTIQSNINVVTSNYNAVDSSKWSTNQPFVSAFVWTNADANSTTTNNGIITATINTNSGSAGGGGVTNVVYTNAPASVLEIAGGTLYHGTNNLVPDASTNILQQLVTRGTNAYWQPYTIGHQNNLLYQWTNQTNLTYQGVVTQSWTVPIGVNLVQIKAWGGGGGGGISAGSQGGFASSTISVSSGDVIYGIVGQGGYLGAVTITTTNIGTGGWPGGGSSVTNGAGTGTGAGGGGYSLVALNSVTNIVCIAGGGGGGAQNGVGGNGGGSVGGSSAPYTTFTVATGGSQIAGGSGGFIAGGVTGQDGSSLQGGSVPITTAQCRGGGGGGGYFGGGSGAGGANAIGGGGGSCYGQYVFRGNNSADETYASNWGSACNAYTNGYTGAIVIRYSYNLP